MFPSVIGFSLLLVWVPCALTEFAVYDQWTKVDFDYDKTQKEKDLKSGKFKPSDVVIYDSQLYTSSEGKETLFVTTPNLFGASPFTLSTVNDNLQAADGSSMLVPFPDESWYSGDCNSTSTNTLTSVFKIKIDRLNRLWVVDSATVNQLTPNSALVCPPQILVFDLNNNNSLIKKYRVPDDQHYDDSLLVNIELDVKNQDGSDTMAYISDVTGYRMLVYDLKTDSSFPIDNPYFNPSPLYCFFRNINGVNFTLLNGLYSISIGAGTNPGRTVYFHSLSSAREGFVSLSTISDSKRSLDAFNFYVSAPRGFHSSVEVMTPTGYLIFANIEENSIMVWDSHTQYTPKNFVTLAKDNKRFQFITGMQLIDNNKLLITSSRYQNVLTGNIAKNETNYRVLINLDISKFITRR